jgi:hypothetical protein
MSTYATQSRRGRGDIGRMGGIGITRKIFDDLEDFIQDVKHSKQKAQVGIDLLVRAMILTTKGLAQQKSGGPVAARRRSNPA